MTQKKIAALTAALYVATFSVQFTYSYYHGAVLGQTLPSANQSEVQTAENLEKVNMSDTRDLPGQKMDQRLPDLKVDPNSLTDSTAKIARDALTFNDIEETETEVIAEPSQATEPKLKAETSDAEDTEIPAETSETAVTETARETSETVQEPSSAPTADRKTQRLPWFGQVDGIYAKGDVAKVTDLATGLTMQIMRTGGTNHADCETLDTAGTEILFKIAGGEWNWTRRPCIVEIDGYRIAASFTARPHAGRDDLPAHEYVKNRSGGYGSGINWDSVKGNGMDGHFDIHFYKSRTHVSNKVDAEHQAAIQAAYESGK